VLQIRDKDLIGHMWLDNVINSIQKNKNQSTLLQLPLKNNRQEYRIEETTDAQQNVLCGVIKTIKQWMTNSKEYVPYHRIIAGGGGAGKSYLIHQITTVIRKMFNYNDTVETSAFTGSAAYNIGGKTMHSAYCISCTDPSIEISQNNRDKLTKRMRYTIAVIFDERSMISAELIGAVERNIANTCHGGNKHRMVWGGIPIVLFFGDDFQLPPVNIMGKGKGAFYALEYKQNKYSKGLTIELRGMQELLRLSKNAIILEENKRVVQGQEEFKDILTRVRTGQPTDNDKNTLLSLSFMKLPEKLREQYENSGETMYLFATKESCSEHNFKKLQQHNSEDNPVAFIKHKIPQHLRNKNNDQNTIPEVTCFSRGCKVSIRGKNFCPEIGLYNGAIGTVREIVYKKNESPNTGHLPLYVAVEFASYLGHLPQYGNYVWDKNNPTTIPVPTVTMTDEKSRKSINFCPLALSFARTIHTFQGQSAGPTKDNNQHPIKRIICDVGTAKFESQNIGLFYTALSRATTIGTKENNRNDSAIFFTESLDKTRLDRLTTKVDNTEYDLVKRRNAWMQRISTKKYNDNFDKNEKQQLIEWAGTQRYNIEDIEKKIQHEYG